jgi:hypothetical protein
MTRPSYYPEPAMQTLAARLSARFAAPVLALTALAAAANTAEAQVIQSVRPEMAEPGKEITFYGSNLSQVDRISFTGIVGGFVGQLTIDVTPTSTGDSFVKAIVPQFNAFIPQGQGANSEIIGFIQAYQGNTQVVLISFGYAEATYGDIDFIGQGGAEAYPLLTPEIDFWLAGGLPTAGNASFSPRVSGAPPFSSCLLAVGPPIQGPPLPFAGGELYLQSTPTPLILAPVLQAGGLENQTALTVPIPASVAGSRPSLQWFGVDPATGTLFASNAVSVQL